MDIRLFSRQKKAAKRIFYIINGPDKESLFNACRYVYSDRDQVDVKFDVALRSASDPEHLLYIRDIKILSIEYESESDKRFYLNGVCMADLITQGENAKNYRFKAFYHTERRDGVIKFEER